MVGVNPQQASKLRYYWRHVKRNALSVGFPLVLGTAILADWTRTQRFKKQQALLAKTQEVEKTETYE